MFSFAPSGISSRETVDTWEWNDFTDVKDSGGQTAVLYVLQLGTKPFGTLFFSSWGYNLEMGLFQYLTSAYKKNNCLEISTKRKMEGSWMDEKREKDGGRGLIRCLKEGGKDWCSGSVCVELCVFWLGPPYHSSVCVGQPSRTRSIFLSFCLSSSCSPPLLQVFVSRGGGGSENFLLIWKVSTKNPPQVFCNIIRH